jgi:tetratricopeptide (TPR) repeat protein
MEIDSLLEEAAHIILENNYVSTPLIQRKLCIGYNRTCRIIDQMVQFGIISNYPTPELPAELLVNSKEDVKNILNNIEEKQPSERIEARSIINQDIINEYSSLYNEKRYIEVIELFEQNLSSQVDINQVELLDKYLWALWLNDGTEESAWELAKEYSSKFNTNRWDILKGHYSKWKKWYDYALDYYKDSSEDGYNEIKKIFDDYYSLYYEEKYAEVIEYFENKLSNSVSEKHLKIADKYLWALYNNSGTEKKALEKTKKFLEDYPDNTDWVKLAGHISKWLGSKNKDIDLLNEAIFFYKKVNSKEGINEVNEKINEVKVFHKERLAEEKQAEKERIAEEKRVEQEKKDSQHKFKSSRGETFCQYCGKSTIWNDSPCEGKKNGHNYIYMKDSYGNWELTCNNCGRSHIWYDSPCS